MRTTTLIKPCRPGVFKIDTANTANTAMETPPCDLDMGECYICLDETRPAPRSTCGCISAFVHPNCQLRLLRENYCQGLHCTVCKRSFTNLGVRSERRLWVNTKALFLLALAFGWVACSNLVITAIMVIIAFLWIIKFVPRALCLETVHITWHIRE